MFLCAGRAGRRSCAGGACAESSAPFSGSSASHSGTQRRWRGTRGTPRWRPRSGPRLEKNKTNRLWELAVPCGGCTRVQFSFWRRRTLEYILYIVQYVLHRTLPTVYNPLQNGEESFAWEAAKCKGTQSSLSDGNHNRVQNCSKKFLDLDSGPSPQVLSVELRIKRVKELKNKKYSKQS